MHIKHKFNRESCYAYPVRLTFLAGNQIATLNINSTSPRYITLLPPRQRRADFHELQPSGPSQSPIAQRWPRWNGPQVTSRGLLTEERKKKTERRKKKLLLNKEVCWEWMPLVIFQQLSRQTFHPYKCLSKPNRRNSWGETVITASVDKLKATVNGF